MELISINASHLVCEHWKNEHIVLVRDVHFFNRTFYFVKIDSLHDLNISIKCQPVEYNVEALKIIAKKNILINNDLDLRAVMRMFNRTNIKIFFQNVNGFNEINRNVEYNLNTEKSIQINNAIFDFYREGKLLERSDCSSGNFNAKTNFFGPIKYLMLISNIFYNNPICPYVFMNTKLEQLFLSEISNSLIFKNRVEFLNKNKTQSFDMNIKYLSYLVFNLYVDEITSNNLNPLVFKTIKFIFIKGNLEYIQSNLFDYFKEIRYISIKSDALLSFFHRGTQWINSINRNLNVSLLSNGFKNNRLVSIEFNVKDGFLFNQYYTFPNEDICLFKDFPHSQLVLPLIVFAPIRIYLFNILFCLIYLFSLTNICIFPKNSFCSSIWRTEFSQYFHIYVILFLGNSLRLCCNISYIFFSVSRFALSGTSNKNKLRKFIEKQKIKRFYLILFFVTLGFSVFVPLENYVNKPFEEYDYVNPNNNAYDIRYCEDFRVPHQIKLFSLNATFYIK
jgi:hypothetical protein